VAAPPLDFECILNEPIWFNRFLYFHTDTKRGLFLKKDTQNKLIRKGIMHLADLLSPIPSAGRYSPWLTSEEANLKNGSIKLGSALMSVIDLIPHEWSSVVRKKRREPLQIGDWVIYRYHRYCAPSTLLEIVEIFPNRALAHVYRKLHDCALFIATETKLSVSKASIVKACVLKLDINKKTPVYVYSGNYAASKLLLLRLSLQTDSIQVRNFFELNVKTLYRATMYNQANGISAISKWEKRVVNLIICTLVKIISLSRIMIVYQQTRQKRNFIKFTHELCLLIGNSITNYAAPATSLKTRCII
jgi:hypothetical protein